MDASLPVDIKAAAPYPAGALSNFAPYAFVFEGVRCASMEGFLQGLKIRDPDEQRRVCALVGEHANSAGRQHDWTAGGLLWWQGQPIERHSDDYQQLLDRAYRALFEQSEAFHRALAATGTAPLAHSNGKTDPRATVLTVDELCSRLERLRGGKL